MAHIWRISKKRIRLHNIQNGACALCGKGLSLRAGGIAAPTLDHIIPKSNGGTGEMENLRLVHRGCNEARGNEIESVTIEFNGYRVLRAAPVATPAVDALAWPVGPRLISERGAEE